MDNYLSRSTMTSTLSHEFAEEHLALTCLERSGQIICTFIRSIAGCRG